MKVNNTRILWAEAVKASTGASISLDAIYAVSGSSTYKSLDMSYYDCETFDVDPTIYTVFHYEQGSYQRYYKQYISFIPNMNGTLYSYYYHRDVGSMNSPLVNAYSESKNAIISLMNTSAYSSSYEMKSSVACSAGISSSIMIRNSTYVSVSSDNLVYTKSWVLAYLVFIPSDETYGAPVSFTEVYVSSQAYTNYSSLYSGDETISQNPTAVTECGITTANGMVEPIVVSDSSGTTGIAHSTTSKDTSDSVVYIVLP